MKVISFARFGYELMPVEVEVSLAQGLPTIQISGLPDVSVKESVLRIRSALREQGFELPQAHQILVHLRPSHIKKKSQGLDLAIALGILWEMAQLEPPPKIPVVYGELSLKGEVFAPDDLDEISWSEDGVVLTGQGAHVPYFPIQRVSKLRDMATGDSTFEERQAERWVRPSIRVKSVAKSAAEIVKLSAAGEHSVLLFGPPGSGKTTLAEIVPALIEEPIEEEFREARRFARRVGQDLAWRPVLRPHHSITPLAMVGGGNSLWAGEITRSHTGVLIMDELLEFHAEIQEALREPVESGVITLVRGGKSITYPARLLLLATTNLCRCGNFVPKSARFRCRCSAKEVRKTLSRLTGPFVDRFAILASSENWENEDDVSTGDLLEAVTRALRFRQESRKQSVPNARLLSETIEDSLNAKAAKFLSALEVRSRRRKSMLLRVARTYADLRGASEITDEDLHGSMRVCLDEHRRLESALM